MAGESVSYLPKQDADTGVNLRDLREECRAIFYFLNSEEDVGRKRLMFADLVTKAMKLPALEREQWEIEGLRRMARLKKGRGMEQIKRRAGEMSIGALVIKPRELTGVSAYFDFDLAKPDLSEKGYSGWVVDLNGARLTIGFVGEEGGPNTAAAARWLAPIVVPDAMVLIGTAAGVPGRAELGDVVLAERVANYEAAVLYAQETLYRPDFVEEDEEVSRHIAYYEALAHNRVAGFREGITALTAAGLSLSSDGIPGDPKLRAGTILSGDKMFQDGSHTEIRKSIDERTRAFDLESWAFARACKDDLAGVRWLVSRGIADLGLPYQNEAGGATEDRSFQWVAAMAAAAVARDFIERVIVERM